MANLLYRVKTRIPRIYAGIDFILNSIVTSQNCKYNFGQTAQNTAKKLPKLRFDQTNRRCTN